MEDSPETESQCWESGSYHKVEFRKVPFGAWLLSRAGLFNFFPEYSYKLYVLFLTFCCYAAYHMSRKPFSVVAHVLAPNCTFSANRNASNDSELEWTDGYYYRAVDPNDYIDGWPPFNGRRCKTIIGAVDYAWLFTYAVFLFVSGAIADRVNVRYFLTVGMIGSGVFVGLLGVAYYAEIHHLSYFIVVQIFVGIFESTGWPGVISVIGNWLGIKRRGLVMGIWNSHASVGNILGTAVPAIWAVKGKPWSWSFLVPGFVMIVVAFVIFFFLIVDPSHVGLPPPKHHEERSSPESFNKRSSDQSPITGSVSKSKYRNGHHDNTNRLLYSDDESLPLKNRTPPPPFNNDYDDNKNDEETKLIGGEPFHNGHFRHSVSPTPQAKSKKQAIGLIGALKVPGVIEFSLALFFAKLVAYTFLFWLPYYITLHKIEGRYLGEKKSNLLSTLYDVGGIIGGIITGGLSDLIGARATSCVIMMYLAVPTLFLYRYLGPESLALTIFLIIMCGLFINGPYALITTAVSSDLGTHKSLKENQKAKATVGAIIDGMGSFGAACGPLIAGWVSDDFGWDSVFYVLMFSCFVSSLMLSRLLVAELKGFYKNITKYNMDRHSNNNNNNNNNNKRDSPNTLDDNSEESAFQ